MTELDTSEKVKLSSTSSPSPSPSSSLPPAWLQNDLVTLFKPDPEPKIAIKQLQLFANQLVHAGFKFKIRLNKPGSLLIFVRASDRLVIDASYQAQVKDWLHGIRTTLPDPPVVKGKLDANLPIAERLRLVHAKLTGALKDQGLGITPARGDWEHVESIFALHDPEFDKAWLKRWSTKWTLDEAELDIIRDSFGEKVGFYFAFLQHYFQWLAIPSILGIISFFFFSPFSIWFAVASCVWSAVFVESWKRKQVDLAVRWRVLGSSALPVERPEFKPAGEIRDAVTGQTVDYYPSWKRVVKQFAAIPIAIVAGALLVALQAFVFVIEIFLAEIYDGPLKQYLVFLPTALLAGLVPTFTAFYNILITRMTEWENHAAKHTFETSITQKLFVLNFLTSYIGLFLSAYVYLPFGHLIAPNLDLITAVAVRLIGERANTTTTASQFTINRFRLRQQYVYFTATAQVINFFVETILPYLKRRLFKEAQKKLQSNHVVIHDVPADNPDEVKFLNRVRAEAEFPDYDVAEDYREMVVQFGYLTMFSAVWPLSYVFSFANNWVELRGDALKISLDERRPIPEKAESIGPWLNNLAFLTWLGSITSASVVVMYAHAGSGDGENNDATGSSLVNVNSWLLLLGVLFSEHVFLVVRYLVRQVFDAFDSTVQQADRKQEYENRAAVIATASNKFNQAEPHEQDDEEDEEEVVRLGKAEVDYGIELLKRTAKANRTEAESSGQASADVKKEL
ncbi:calcium-activated chloride channel-domain-containing protein [Lipomyces japonicus]|uniref:calcium-activated chloride channel-domain-containing protein n=1 Tax=Lipomyces japonicus TaxID=56871 RepID=UPI0034CD200B